jgi:tetratricopeptide (TPR) repeat protein
MDATIFMEVANEIKALHMSAIDFIRKEEYAEAAVQYRKALIITEKIGYFEGMAFALYNMANLALLVDDQIEAINNASDARDMFEKAGLPSDHCTVLIDKLAVSLKKKGIEHEKRGRFAEAVEYFTASIPFADEKSRKAMEHESELLRRVMKGGK